MSLKTRVPALKKRLAEKLQEQGGVTFYTTTLVNILWFQDTLDRFLPSLHLATSLHLSDRRRHEHLNDI